MKQVNERRRPREQESQDARKQEQAPNFDELRFLAENVHEQTD